MNQTGLFLFGQNGSAVVIQMNLSPSDFRIAKLDASGQFIISTLSGSVLKQEYIGPEDGCLIPFVCGRLGLCTDDTASNSPVCSCPSVLIFQNLFYLLLKGRVEGGRFLYIYSLQLDRVLVDVGLPTLWLPH